MRALLVVACLSLDDCSHLAEDDWLGEDETLHFASPAVPTVADVQMTYSRSLHGARQVRFSLSLLFVLGVDKELYDSRSAGSDWSWKDSAWDLAGAAAGYGPYQAAK